MALMMWRRDTAANFASANPILMQGEWALELDTNKFKQGNGISRYNNLPYISPHVQDELYTNATYAKIYAPSQRATTEAIERVESIIDIFGYQETI